MTRKTAWLIKQKNVHLDGLDKHHDHTVCHKGAFKKATEAIRKLVAAGFRS
ncbi:MAG: hypothetical protein GQ575_03795 [Deltaproteobacteria bacterium]|nr:hypothetical protein [Deltaproteobacteria bacterium]